jgi:hypothetical protein
MATSHWTTPELVCLNAAGQSRGGIWMNQTEKLGKQTSAGFYNGQATGQTAGGKAFVHGSAAS